MVVLPMCLCSICLQKPAEGAGSAETGVTKHCELPDGLWELILGLLEDKKVLITAKPSL